MAKLSEKLKVGDKVDIEHSVFNNERGGEPQQLLQVEDYWGSSD